MFEEGEEIPNTVVWHPGAKINPLDQIHIPLVTTLNATCSTQGAYTRHKATPKYSRQTPWKGLRWRTYIIAIK
jgi:hypothetical protein